jgi:hypothetical protein
MEAADHPLHAGQLGTPPDQCSEGGGVIDENRALHLYELALSLVEAKGVFVTLGVTTFKEYRTGSLTIHYLPSLGRLDVWSRRKVLTIDKLGGKERVTGFIPGEDWEDELEVAAATVPSKR